MYARLEDFFGDELLSVIIEAGDFDRQGLLVESVGLEISRDQCCPLAGVFGCDVVSDGSALEENETIVILFRRQRREKEVYIKTNSRCREQRRRVGA